MGDIPVSNGPKPALPQWAIDSLYAHHMAISGIFDALNMPELSNLHKISAQNFRDGSNEAEQLAEQLGQGWEPQKIAALNCSNCGTVLLLDFDGKCKACGFQHVDYSK